MTQKPFIQELVKEVKSNKSLWPLIGHSYRSIYDGKVADRLAALYLQYVYGAKPLMQDIHGIIELAKDKSNNPLLLSASKKVSGQMPSQKTAFWNPSDRHGINIAMEGESRTSCHLWAEIDPNYRGTRTLNQLGLLNPASLAWELVPFSFVIDWALPIGPVLQALTAPAGLRFVNGSIARRLKAKGPYTISHHWGDGYSDVQRTEGSGLLSYEGYRRDQLGSWPQPGIWFDSDPLRLGSDGSDRVFKAMALAILAFPTHR
jgi:hypothetical protein